MVDIVADSQQSIELLHLLDGLPLALAQASAFMKETSTSFADYIEFYRSQYREIMNSNGDAGQPLPEYPNGNICTTWTISYQAVQRRDPAAAQLLLLWAYLDNKDVWFELLSPAVEYRKLRRILPG